VQVAAMRWMGVPQGAVQGSLKRLSKGSSHVIPDGGSHAHVHWGRGAFGALKPSYTPLE
jgi:hypothetical protein